MIGVFKAAPPYPLHDFKAVYKCCIIIIIFIIETFRQKLADKLKTIHIQKSP